MLLGTREVTSNHLFHPVITSDTMSFTRVPERDRYGPGDSHMGGRRADGPHTQHWYDLTKEERHGIYDQIHRIAH